MVAKNTEPEDLFLIEGSTELSGLRRKGPEAEIVAGIEFICVEPPPELAHYGEDLRVIVAANISVRIISSRHTPYPFRRC
jgi:hypothetical protein